MLKKHQRDIRSHFLDLVEMNTDNDRYHLVIVGGGIIGAWSLYLASMRYPHRRTLLIERSVVGGGATAHSGAISLPVGRTPWERQLAVCSARHYALATDALGLQPDPASAYWVVNGELVESVRDAAVEFATAMSPLGARDLADNVHASAQVGQSEMVLIGGTPLSYDATNMARALVRRSQQLANVVCWEGVGVAAMHPAVGGVSLVLTDGRVLVAEKAIVAVGPWVLGSPGDAAARAAGVRIKKVVALHIDQAPRPGAAALFLPGSDAYLMPLIKRKQWLFSFRSEEWDCTPQGSELAITDSDRATANAILGRYLPGMLGMDRGGRVFCDGYTPTGTPIVALHPENNALVVAGAGAGAGFRLAPGIAESAIQMVL